MRKIKLINNRRAMIFNMMIVLFTIIVLTFAFIRLSDKADKKNLEIGEAPLDLISQIQSGEKALIFLDFAAQMALYQAIYEIQTSGGFVDNQCGTYYGFPLWNNPAGDDCSLSIDDMQILLRDLFISNLVARISSYPDADFVGRTSIMAYAHGSALSVSGMTQKGLVVDASLSVAQSDNSLSKSDFKDGLLSSNSVQVCVGSSEYIKDFDYPSNSGYFPPKSGRVWVPAEANCMGSFPLVIYLHGCMRGTNAYAHRNFGDGSSTDIIPIMKQLVQSKTIQPVIAAAPSQTVGTKTFRNVPNSPCGPSLWGSEFSISKFVDLVKENLPQGVTISSVSVFGHSGAGCSLNSGIHSSASKMNLYSLGQFDTCSGSRYGNSLISKADDSNILIIYGTMGSKREEQNFAMGLSNSINCPESDLNIGIKDCFSNDVKNSNDIESSNNVGNHIAYTMSSPNHKKALLLGTEQFLKIFFKAGEST